MKLLIIGIVLILLLCLLPSWSYADSISCDGGIVSSGDTAVDLLMKCGSPGWKDSHQEEITDRVNPNLKLRTYITVDEWTYNFGPQQFMRIITLRNGVITRIHTGKYGTSVTSETPGPACGGRIISVGDSKTDILIMCGEPLYTTSYQEELKERLDDSTSRTDIVTVEEWTYNFGPQQFMRIVTFRNTKAVDIQTGGYGR